MGSHLYIVVCLCIFTHAWVVCKSVHLLSLKVQSCLEIYFQVYVRGQLTLGVDTCFSHVVLSLMFVFSCVGKRTNIHIPDSAGERGGKRERERLKESLPFSCLSGGVWQSQVLENEVVLTKAFTMALDGLVYSAGVVIAGLGCTAAPPTAVTRALLTAFGLRPIVPVQVGVSHWLRLDEGSIHHDHNVGPGRRCVDEMAH